MSFNRLGKFIDNSSSSVSNYDLLVLENNYYKQFTDVSESIHLMDSVLYEMELLSYVNKNPSASFEDLTTEKGKLTQIWEKVITFLKKLWDQLSELFKKAKEFLFAKAKMLISKIDDLIKKIRMANAKFTINFPDLPVIIENTSPAFGELLQLGSIITETMTLEQVKTAETKLRSIDADIEKAKKEFENRTHLHTTMVRDGSALLRGLEEIKSLLAINIKYIDGYNKNIESARIVMKKMHPDRFVGQDQSLSTAITTVASSASSSYKSAIKYIKDLTDATEKLISDMEKQIEDQLNKTQEQ